jgi:hypothetical protein
MCWVLLIVTSVAVICIARSVLFIAIVKLKCYNLITSLVSDAGFLRYCPSWSIKMAACKNSISLFSCCGS